MSTHRRRKAQPSGQGQAVQNLASPPAPLSPEKQQSLVIARQAIATIEQLVPQQQHFSHKRERELFAANDTLSCQSGIVGIGIEPFHEDEQHGTARLLAIIQNFKQRLEQRYGQYESAHP